MKKVIRGANGVLAQPVLFEPKFVGCVPKDDLSAALHLGVESPRNVPLAMVGVDRWSGYLFPGLAGLETREGNNICPPFEGAVRGRGIKAAYGVVRLYRGAASVKHSGGKKIKV